MFPLGSNFRYEEVQKSNSPLKYGTQISLGFKYGLCELLFFANGGAMAKLTLECAYCDGEHFPKQASVFRTVKDVLTPRTKLLEVLQVFF